MEVPTDRQVPAGGLAVAPQAAEILTLAAVPNAARFSRMFVRHILRQWGLPSLVDDSELVISELVTNAVQATGVTDSRPRWSQLAGLATIHVRLLLFERSVVLAVWDRNPAAPVLKDPETDSENGRGLSIVAALCERWDYLPVQDGKCVWAELAIQPDALASDGLSRRTPGSSATLALEPNTDLDLLRRVHRALKTYKRGRLPFPLLGRRAGHQASGVTRAEGQGPSAPELVMYVSVGRPPTPAR